MTDAKIYQPETALINIGGRRLHLTWDGHGQPSVIFESGLGGTWEPLQVELAQLSSNGNHIFAQHSGHFIHHDEPVLVIAATQ